MSRRKYNFDEEYSEVREEDVTPLFEPKESKAETPELLTSEMFTLSYVAKPMLAAMSDVENKKIVIYDYTVSEPPLPKEGEKVMGPRAKITASVLEWDLKIDITTYSKVVIGELVRLRDLKLLPSKNGIVVTPRKRLSGNGREYWTIAP